MTSGLTLLCTALQVSGIVLLLAWKLLPTFMGVVIGICGFASIVKGYLPASPMIDQHIKLSPLVGLTIILIACVLVHRRGTKATSTS